MEQKDVSEGRRPETTRLALGVMVDLPDPLPQTDRSTEIVPWPLWLRKALWKRTFLHRHQRSALATARLYSAALAVAILF